MRRPTSQKKSVKANLAKVLVVAALALGSLVPLAVSAGADPTPTPTPTPANPAPKLPSPVELQVSWNS